MTQIMNLLMLAPAIQEEILFLPRVENGRDKVCLRDLQVVASVVDWHQQRRFTSCFSKSKESRQMGRAPLTRNENSAPVIASRLAGPLVLCQPPHG